MLITQVLIHVAAMWRVVATAAVAQSGCRNGLTIGISTRIAMAVARHRVALQAEHGLRKVQQFAVRCAMRAVAGGAILDGGRMLEGMRAAHILMALGALLRLCLQSELLATMRVVAVLTGNATFIQRVVRTHAELGDDILVAACAQSRFLARFLHADA